MKKSNNLLQTFSGISMTMTCHGRALLKNKKNQEPNTKFTLKIIVTIMKISGCETCVGNFFFLLQAKYFSKLPCTGQPEW